MFPENRSQLAEVEARDVKKRVTKRSGEAAKVAAELGLTRNDPNGSVLRSLLKEERDVSISSFDDEMSLLTSDLD